MKRIEELSPEEVLEKKKLGLAKQKEANAENIKKLTARMKKATGTEKERLVKLIALHTEHKLYLDIINVEEEASSNYEELI